MRISLTGHWFPGHPRPGGRAPSVGWMSAAGRRAVRAG